MIGIGHGSTRDDAEAAILGSVLLSDNALDTILEEGIRPEHFWRGQHETIFRAMINLKDAGKPIDTLTLRARFDSPQSTVSVVDIDLLSSAVPRIGSVREYCRFVREAAWFEKVERTLFDAHEAVVDRDRDRVTAELARLDLADDGPLDDPDNATEFLDWYEQDQKGWPLPFTQLVEATGGGLYPGEPSIIASWSGFRKTFWLSQVLRRCVKAGANVVEFANEMHGPKRTARTLTSMTGIPQNVIESKRLNGDQWKHVNEALKNFPYRTIPSAGWSVEQYCREIRRRKPDVAAIDTASNLPCSRIDEWDRAATMLADTCAQTGTHLIQIFQLNLERDKGKRPPPVARDIRFGGTFYARARVVMFLHRDQEAKEADMDQVIWTPTDMGHIRVDKATHGDGDPSTAFLPVMFNSRFLRFDQMETREQWAA